jgi:Ca-activated chloride channel family protein
MTRFLSIASLLGLALFLVGCSDPAPRINPAQVKRTDPQAVPPGQPGAQDPQGEVSLTRNFYIVFDGSGSMSGRRMERAKTAFRAFIDGLPNDVNVGLYRFDGYGQGEVVPLGTIDRAKLHAACNAIYAGNGTPLGAAIRDGKNALVAQKAKQLGYGDYRLIVITDGEPDSLSDMNAAVDECATSAVPICTIGIDIGPNHSLRKGSLMYKNTENVNELKEALKEATSEQESFDPTSFKK